MTTDVGEPETAPSSALRPGAPSGLRGVDVVWALGVALAFLLVCEAAAGWMRAHAPEGTEPVGVVADPHLVDMSALYGSFARESGEGGGLRVHNHQTAEPHPATQARPWDFLIGRLSFGLGGGPQLAFQLDRVLACLLFALSFAFLLGELVVSSRVRALGVLAAFTGGSFYWIYELVGRDAPGADVLREWLRAMGDLSGLGFAFPVLLSGVPHLMLELVFFGAACAFLLRSVRRDSDLEALGAGLALLLQCSVRPYTVPVGFACAGAVLGREWLRAERGQRARWVRRLALALVPALPLVVHYYQVVRGDTVFSSLDVYHPAPSLLEQCVFFGVPVLVAALFLVPGVRSRRRALGRTPRALPALLLAWATVNLLLVHGEVYPAPFTVGWEVEAMLPLPFLVLVLALLVADVARPRTLATWGAALVALHAVPSFVFAGAVAVEVESSSVASLPLSPLLLRTDEHSALRRLEELRPADALTADRPPIVLLAHPELGPLVPWLAGVRVYLGHPDHTPNSRTRRAQVESFFGDGHGGPALSRLGVTHVLWGPRERALATRGGAIGAEEAFLREAGPHLVPVFETGDVQLFELRPAD